MIDYDDICECVIVHTSPSEDALLKSKESDGGVYLMAYVKMLFTDGRPHCSDVDCIKCDGTGDKNNRRRNN